jgi:Glycosyl hydrolase family 26
MYVTVLVAVLAVGVAIGPASAGAARTVSVGAFVSGADENPAMIDDFTAAVGRRQAIVVSYKSWEQAPFSDQLDGIWSHGAVPMITWEPWSASLWRIAAGDYDGYVQDAARAAAAWDRPLMVRFAQEMNAAWFPWGGDPAAYKAAWRHLVRVFSAAGADNVRWVWTPYANNAGSMPFSRYFPGGKWVDWVGFDVINWGGGPTRWGTFTQTAGRSYRQLLRLTPKPMILGEVGSGEVGGSKARWLSRMLRHDIPRMSHVRAICFWSELDQRGDLRVNSSPAALRAVRRALARPLYRSSRGTFLNTPAWLGG